MAKITLKEALKQASVVDELKNFVGLTKDDAVGLMTPERLAAVAGGKMPTATAINNGLVPKALSESFLQLKAHEAAMVHCTKDIEWDVSSFLLYVCTDNVPLILSASCRSGASTSLCRIEIISKGRNNLFKVYKRLTSKHIIEIYIENTTDFYMYLTKSNLYSSGSNSDLKKVEGFNADGMEEIIIQ